MSLVHGLLRNWRQSLQFRTVVSTVLVTVLVVGAAGAILVERVSNGLIDAKQRAALAEAAAGRSIARSFAEASWETDPGKITDELVSNLAARAGKPPAYDVVLMPAPGSGDLPGAATSLVGGQSVPPQLVETLRAHSDTAWTYGDITFTDDRSEPGLIVGAPVTVRGIGQYELYYLFGLRDVNRSIALVRSTVFAVGVVLVVALGLLAWWFSRRLVRPVGQAARTATALATGDLSRRLTVSGEDDMARLAGAFNSMADSLENQILQLQGLSEMQRRFVADVSHELRTPLTTIRMAAEVLAGTVTSTDPGAVRTVQLLNSEVDRFERLLTDLLEVSKIDAGQVSLDREVTDMAVLVAELLNGMRALAADHDSLLHLSSPPACVVECDPRRVGRILRNLLVNAIEYGQGHPIEVVVRGEPGLAVVTVTDHGPGLAPQDQAKVFERFWRADPARARTLGGTGLGLAISREDARLNGGDLTVSSQPGHGCTFTLTLPRSSDSASAGGKSGSVPLEGRSGSVPVAGPTGTAPDPSRATT